MEEGCMHDVIALEAARFSQRELRPEIVRLDGTGVMPRSMLKVSSGGHDVYATIASSAASA
jgi:hypothetical protein